MHKFKIILVSTLLLLAQQVFADTSAMPMPGSDDEGVASKPCKNIAEACVKAGFFKKGEMGKTFWFDCMKPIIMNKTVNGVTVDPKDVQACREDKIKRLQKDLADFQAVK